MTWSFRGTAVSNRKSVDVNTPRPRRFDELFRTHVVHAEGVHQGRIDAPAKVSNKAFMLPLISRVPCLPPVTSGWRRAIRRSPRSSAPAAHGRPPPGIRRSAPPTAAATRSTGRTGPCGLSLRSGCSCTEELYRAGYYKSHTNVS